MISIGEFIGLSIACILIVFGFIACVYQTYTLYPILKDALEELKRKWNL